MTGLSDNQENELRALVDQHFSEIDELAIILRQITDTGGQP
jgi:hypothetical protein